MSGGAKKVRALDCETGYMPPYGHLCGLEVFADRTLAED